MFGLRRSIRKSEEADNSPKTRTTPRSREGTGHVHISNWKPDRNQSARMRARCGTPVLTVWDENVPPHCNCRGKLVVSAAPCRSRHERKRYNLATYECFSESSFSLHVVPRAPAGIWDRPESAIGPSSGQDKGDRYTTVSTPYSSLQRSNLFSISGVICRLRAFAAATKARCGTYQFLILKLRAWRKAELTNGTLISSRMAISAASWHIAVISAPEHPLVCESPVLNSVKPNKVDARG